MSRREVILCTATEEEIAAAQLRDALDFYDKVNASSDDEKIAVGTDHIDTVIDRARRVAKSAPLLVE
jgi:hypothetical protein